MATFNFNTDEKKTIWYRKYFTIEAETLEEAKAKAIKIEQEGEWIEGADWEQLTDTCEELSVYENGGMPTVELFYNDDDCIWNNSINEN
jgi:hypothetical protein